MKKTKPKYKSSHKTKVSEYKKTKKNLELKENYKSDNNIPRRLTYSSYGINWPLTNLPDLGCNG